MFNSENHADTVILSNGNGQVLYSLATSGGVANVNWALSAGQQYLLLQTADSNAMFNSYNGGLPTSNADISITDTGLFGCSGAVYANCGIKGQSYWTAFTNISTGAANNVPEPGSIALLGLALASLAVARRRKAN